MDLDRELMNVCRPHLQHGGDLPPLDVVAGLCALVDPSTVRASMVARRDVDRKAEWRVAWLTDDHLAYARRTDAPTGMGNPSSSWTVDSSLLECWVVQLGEVNGMVVTEMHGRLDINVWDAEVAVRIDIVGDRRIDAPLFGFGGASTQEVLASRSFLTGLQESI